MPRSATARRPAPAALPDLPLPSDEPPTVAFGGEARVIQLVPSPVIRVGDYEVGEGYCPRLHGHPGIRY